MRWGWFMGACACILCSCSDKPSAPPLEDGPVYKDSREGFRFFTPKGWKQTARGGVPAGPVKGERMLVEYTCLTCAQQTRLMVTVASLPPDTPLDQFVSKRTAGGDKWRLIEKPQNCTVNGAPAVR